MSTNKNFLSEALDGIDELDALMAEDALACSPANSTMDLLEDLLDEATFADEQPSVSDEIDSLQVFSQDNLSGLTSDDIDSQFHPDNIDHMNDEDSVGSGIDPEGRTAKSALVSSLLGEDTDEESVDIDEEDFTLDDEDEDDFCEEDE